MNEGTDESQEKYLDAIKLLEQRENLIENDFVGYYQKTTGQTFTPSELIEKQTSMGILPADIRITSNAQIDDFMATFRGTENYSEQSQLGEQFLAQFGDENSVERNIVMRHLHEKERITIVDQLVIANPTSTDINLIRSFNEEKSVKELDALVKGDRLNEINERIAEVTVDYTVTMLGGITDGVIDPATSPGRVNHILNIQEVIRNTAKGLVQIQGLSPKDAVEQAYNSVIGNYFEFEGTIRFPKTLKNQSENMSLALNLSIKRPENKDYLRSIIQFPPTPQGENEERYQEGYLDDLTKYGSWRTNVQTNGVFLVDQLGNIVPRKPELIEQGQEQYITVSFDSLQPVLLQLQKAKDKTNFIDDQRKEFMRLLQGNQFF